MSLIKDIRSELKALDQSSRNLRKFSLLFFCICSVFFVLELRKPNANPQLLSGILAACFLLGVAWPLAVKKVHLVWMTFAFILGWVVSRFIMIVMFYLVISPFGFIARLFGKKFIDLGFHGQQDTYWIPKTQKQNIDYRKIF